MSSQMSNTFGWNPSDGSFGGRRGFLIVFLDRHARV